MRGETLAVPGKQSASDLHPLAELIETLVACNLDLKKEDGEDRKSSLLDSEDEDWVGALEEPLLIFCTLRKDCCCFCCCCRTPGWASGSPSPWANHAGRACQSLPRPHPDPEAVLAQEAPKQLPGQNLQRWDKLLGLRDLHRPGSTGPL